MQPKLIKTFKYQQNHRSQIINLHGFIDNMLRIDKELVGKTYRFKSLPGDRTVMILT